MLLGFGGCGECAERGSIKFSRQQRAHGATHSRYSLKTSTAYDDSLSQHGRSGVFPSLQGRTETRTVIASNAVEVLPHQSTEGIAVDEGVRWCESIVDDLKEALQATAQADSVRFAFGGQFWVGLFSLLSPSLSHRPLGCLYPHRSLLVCMAATIVVGSARPFTAAVAFGSSLLVVSRRSCIYRLFFPTLCTYTFSGVPRTPTSMAQPPPTATASSVLVLQFSERVPPGHVQYFFDTHSITYHILRVDLPFVLRHYIDETWRAIVVLGGPQGSYEEEQYPFLRDVKQLLAAQLQHNTPILGICLGCQLLADVIGGRAYKAQQPELGYVDMRPTEPGSVDPLLSQLAPHIQAALYLNHHGDTFTLPPNCPPLLTSELHPQAFRYRSAFAVQFHPEATLREFSSWLDGDSDERMALVGRNKAEVLADVKAKEDRAVVASKEFMRVWWKEVVDGKNVAPGL